MFDNNGYFGIFMVISVNRRLFRYFGSYSGISVISVILVNRRTDKKVHPFTLVTHTIDFF